MTGSGLIGGSWVLCHRFWVTGLVAVPVLIWMIYFLWVYPQLFRQLQTHTPAMDAHMAVVESDRQS